MVGRRNESRRKDSSPREFQTLRKRLPIIIQRYPALDRQAKAESLAEATGQPLQKLKLVCDLRPVFDKGGRVGRNDSTDDTKSRLHGSRRTTNRDGSNSVRKGRSPTRKSNG